MAEEMKAARIEVNRKPDEIVGAPGAAKEVDPEYQELVSKAAADNAKLAAKIGMPEQIKQCDDPHVAGDNPVAIIVPKTFTLTEDDRSKVIFTQGVRMVSPRHAAHWWVKNHGCTIADGRKPAA